MEKYIIEIKDPNNFQVTFERNGEKQRIDYHSNEDCDLVDAFDLMAKSIIKCDGINIGDRMPGFEFEL